MRRKIVFAFFIMLVAVSLQSCIRQRISEDEKILHVTVHDLLSYGIIVPENYSRYERYTKSMYFDSTFELEYEFQPADDTESTVLFLNSSLSFERSSSERAINDAIQQGLSGRIFKAKGIDLVERNELYQYGSKSRLFDIVNQQGNLVGNYFFATNKGMSLTFIIIGLYIDDPDIWSDLFEEKLQKAENLKTGFFSLNHG